MKDKSGVALECERLMDIVYPSLIWVGLATTSQHFSNHQESNRIADTWIIYPLRREKHPKSPQSVTLLNYSFQSSIPRPQLYWNLSGVLLCRSPARYNPSSIDPAYPSSWMRPALYVPIRTVKELDIYHCTPPLYQTKNVCIFYYTYILFVT